MRSPVESGKSMWLRWTTVSETVMEQTEGSWKCV